MKLFKMKTRQMVDKSFSQYLVYQAFQAISHDIFNDKTWFPTSRCSCEDVFYEVFCIVDKTLIMVALSSIDDFDGDFDNGKSFCKYLTEQLGLPSDLTNASAISKRFSKMRGEFPNWSFDDVSDPNARQKLINIAKRFVAIYRKGQ